jgi:hypothetical protein
MLLSTNVQIMARRQDVEISSWQSHGLFVAPVLHCSSRRVHFNQCSQDTGAYCSAAFVTGTVPVHRLLPRVAGVCESLSESIEGEVVGTCVPGRIQRELHFVISVMSYNLYPLPPISGSCLQFQKEYLICCRH